MNPWNKFLNKPVSKKVLHPNDTYDSKKLYNKNETVVRFGVTYKANKSNMGADPTITDCWTMEYPKKILPVKKKLPETIPVKEEVKPEPPKEKIIIVEKIVEKIIKEPVRPPLDTFWIS